MRTVLLDVDGVIINGMHSDPARWRRWDLQLQADLGIDPQRLIDEFFKGVFARDVVVGRRPLIAALEDALPSLGYSGSPLSFVAYWFERDSELNLPLVEAVRALAATGAARLYLATNQEHLRAHHLWSTLGLRQIFTDIFYSARFGAVKPGGEFFAEVGRRIGPQSEPPLLFDDSPAVIAAASEVGWESVLYRDVEDFRGHPSVAGCCA